ncbi:Hsp20/alpha crystallin family protein [Pendulispora brunnea]|uniref:Hsp20/alpha crystallin family protein n=1 Tax=Pendulispora brunnea TaxID=2905690 RepID=A0ABZ2K247_9BACT
MNTSQNLAQRPRHTTDPIQQHATVAARVDVFENKDEVLLLAEMPGATADGVNVHLDQGKLTISGRRPPLDAPGVLLAGEFQPRDYHRTFAIPQGIDGAKIAAKFVDGVLQIHLPKSETLKPRRIEVKAG